MLLELLPHFSRLIPVADKYFASRGASDKAQEAALAALSGEVRSELGEVTGELERVAEASSVLARRMEEQASQMAGMRADLSRARDGVEAVDARVAKLERKLASVMQLAWVLLGMLAAMLVLAIFAMVRH